MCPLHWVELTRGSLNVAEVRYLKLKLDKWLLEFVSEVTVNALVNIRLFRATVALFYNHKFSIFEEECQVELIWNWHIREKMLFQALSTNAWFLFSYWLRSGTIPAVWEEGVTD